MAYVPVPKDLTKVKSKFAFNLTKRQILCFGLSAAIGLPLFFLLKGATGTTVAAFAMILVMLPCFLFAMYEKNGQPLEKLLRLFFRIIDPVTVDQQGEDIGHQYRTGVYHQDTADVPVIRHELAKLEAQVGQPLAVEACPLEHFYPAEEYHQKYLDKNPGGYCHVPWAAINGVKDVRLEDV